MAYVVAFSGRIPMATNFKPILIEVSLADPALPYHAYREAPTQVSVQASDTSLTVAAKVYSTECSVLSWSAQLVQAACCCGYVPAPASTIVDIDDDPDGSPLFAGSLPLVACGRAATDGRGGPPCLWPLQAASTGVIFWPIKNGICLTGMPPFAPTLTDDQIWQEAIVLGYADHFSNAAQAELALPAPSGS